MRFKIPSTFQVGGTDYKVTSKKNLAADRSRYGETAYFSREIHLDPELSSQERESTFIHEVAHVVEDTYACRLSESQVKRMAEGIYQVLRQLEVADAQES